MSQQRRSRRGEREMTDKRDWNQTISRWAGWLVATLAVIAFILSYNALRQVAADYGIPYNLSFIWPLLVDFALIVFSMAVLSASLLGERTIWPWMLVGLFTVATIGFNLIHAQSDPVSRVVAIVAPIALFLSFETLMGMVKRSVKRAGVIASLAQLDEKAKGLTGEIITLRATISRLDNQRIGLTSELATLQGEKQAAIETIAKDVGVSSELVAQARDVLSRYQSEGLSLPSGAKLGEELGVSRTAGNNVKRILLPEFEMPTNGKH